MKTNKQLDQIGSVKDIVVGRVYNVLPSMLVCDAKDNMRFGAPPDLRPLQRSILETGIISSLGATLFTPAESKAHDGKLGALNIGFNRYAIASAMENDDTVKDKIVIPVRFTTPATVLLSKRANVEENVRRHEMTAMDIATAIKRLLEAGDTELSIRKLFAPLGRDAMSQIRYQQYLRLNDLKRELQVAIQVGDIGAEVALQSTGLPANHQVRALERMLAKRGEKELAEKKAEEVWEANERKKAEQAALKGERPPAPAPRPGITNSGKKSRAAAPGSKPATVSEFHEVLRDEGIAEALGRTIQLDMTAFKQDVKALSAMGGRFKMLATVLLSRIEGKITLDLFAKSIGEVLMETPDAAALAKAAPAKTQAATANGATATTAPTEVAAPVPAVRIDKIRRRK